MKDILRQLFSPILKPFENSAEDYNYKPSHRKILLAVGSLFLFLAAVSVYIAILTYELASLIPILVFFLGGMICMIIGGLGTDKAVAKIWGNR